MPAGGHEHVARTLPSAGNDRAASPRHSTRRPSLRAPCGFVVASFLLASVLAACSQVQARRDPPASTSSPAVLAMLARTPGPSRPELARRDAVHLLSLVRLPAGARQLARAPDSDAKLLSSAGESLGDPDVVDLHRFFVVPMSSWALYRYEQRHPPLGSTSRGGYNSSGTSSVNGDTNEWFVSYSWLPVKMLLDTRLLVVSIATLPNHRSGVRLDAEVTWLPAKPAGDTIPGGAKVLTAVLSAGMNRGEAARPPVTTTDPRKIEAIRDFINQLTVIAPGVRFCPVDFGQHLTISFRKRLGATAFAVVVADVGGCEEVQVERSGQIARPGLSGYGLAPFVERELGFS